MGMEFQTEATVHNGSITLEHLPYEEGVKVFLTVSQERPSKLPSELTFEERSAHFAKFALEMREIMKDVKVDPKQTWPREVIYEEERV